eukprot:Lankesteria_metandrocarpae@DN3966_c0_g3_i1.p1
MADHQQKLVILQTTAGWLVVIGAVWITTGYLQGTYSETTQWLRDRLKGPLTKYWPFNKSATVTKERMLSVLRDLAFAFFLPLTELSAVSANVLMSMKQSGLDKRLSPEQIADAIMRQGHHQYLEDQQKTVLEEHGLSESVFEEATAALGQDETVAAWIKGIASMRQSAMKGVAPLLPFYELPAAVTSAKTLSVFREVNGEKRRMFSSIFKTSSETGSQSNGLSVLPSDALVSDLKAAADTAEGGVLASNKEFNGDKIMYKHALAYYMQNDADFRTKKSAAESKHEDEVAGMLTGQTDASSNSTPLIEEILPLDERTKVAHTNDEATADSTPTTPDSSVIIQQEEAAAVTEELSSGTADVHSIPTNISSAELTTTLLPVDSQVEVVQQQE